MLDVFDNELDIYFDSIEENSYCKMCDKKIDSSEDYCSSKCFSDSNR